MPMLRSTYHDSQTDRNCSLNRRVIVLITLYIKSHKILRSVVAIALIAENVLTLKKVITIYTTNFHSFLFVIIASDDTSSLLSAARRI